MALDREAIYTALLARLTPLQASLSLPLAPSRRFRDLDQVAPAEQPCIFLVSGDETAEREKGLPPKWTLRPTVLVYARTDEETGNAPSTILNPILTAIEGALEWAAGDGHPAPKSATTLGQTVLGCNLTAIEIGEGPSKSGPQGVAVLHLEVLALGAA